jgi:hypothetical protein
LEFIGSKFTKSGGPQIYSKTRRPFEEIKDRKASKPKDHKARGLEEFFEGLEVQGASRPKTKTGDCENEDTLKIKV